MTGITPAQISALRACIEVADPGSGVDPVIEQIIADATRAMRVIEVYQPRMLTICFVLGGVAGFIVATVLYILSIFWR